MDTLYLVNGLVYMGRSFAEKTIRVHGGKLTVLDSGSPTEGGAVLDAAGLRIVPGFIDTHTHGAGGWWTAWRGFRRPSPAAWPR